MPPSHSSLPSLREEEEGSAVKTRHVQGGRALEVCRDLWEEVETAADITPQIWEEEA